MTFRTATGPLRYLIGVILLAACPITIAQYVWIDDKGVKQLSDRPPPPSVPDKHILKAPGKPRWNPNTQPASAPAAAPVTTAETDVAEAAGSATASLAAREQAFQRRRADTAAAERKTAEDAQQKADTAANCEAARQNQRALDQGMRMVNVDKNGERAVLSDQERAEMGKKNQKVLAGCQ